MVRRSLGVALWMLAGLLACFLGALASRMEEAFSYAPDSRQRC